MGARRKQGHREETMQRCPQTDALTQDFQQRDNKTRKPPGHQVHAHMKGSSKREHRGAHKQKGWVRQATEATNRRAQKGTNTKTPMAEHPYHKETRGRIVSDGDSDDSNTQSKYITLGGNQ